MASVIPPPNPKASSFISLGKMTNFPVHTYKQTTNVNRRVASKGIDGTFLKQKGERSHRRDHICSCASDRDRGRVNIERLAGRQNADLWNMLIH